MGFCANDASIDTAPLEDQNVGCFGFYPCDAYGYHCNVFDAAEAEVSADATDTDVSADVDTDE